MPDEQAPSSEKDELASEFEKKFRRHKELRCPLRSVPDSNDFTVYLESEHALFSDLLPVVRQHPENRDATLTLLQRQTSEDKEWVESAFESASAPEPPSHGGKGESSDSDRPGPSKSSSANDPESTSGHKTQDQEKQDHEKLPEKSLRGRALLCSCFVGKRISITVRTDEKTADLTSYDPTPQAPEVKLGYVPSSNLKHGVVSIQSVTSLLSTLVLSKARLPNSGLIVVSGATNSAKSKIARGIIHEYLTSDDYLGAASARSRRPHLVTYEDPIEKFLYKPDLDPQDAGIDYTPRQKGTDVNTLGEAVSEAKRQTPSVLFIGEMRSSQDWQEVLAFAGSGHLVVTTTHAGSLTATFDLLFSAVDAKTAARRGETAGRIAAVIHLRSVRVRCCDRPLLLPALWRRTDTGVNSMISDGLSSIVPNNPGVPNPAEESSLGRSWFAKELLPPGADQRDAFEQEALKLDLRGE